MPIQAAANRLKMEIESGKTRSVQPVAPKEEEKKSDAKADDKKGGKDKKGKKEKPVEVKKVPPTQYEILMQIGIPEDDIPQFKDSMHWLKFFPPQGQKDLKAFGVSADWRRSFITTSVNPFYD